MSFTEEITTAIQNAIGKQSATLHAPTFTGNESKYIQECIDSTFVSSVGKFVDLFEDELKNYAFSDFRRFVYTFNLTKDLNGKCLELGANPYFTTILLKYFTDLNLEN